MMTQFKICMRRFLRCESGATAMEYVLLAALIAVVGLIAIMFLGESNSNQWDNVADKISNA